MVNSRTPKVLSNILTFIMVRIALKSQKVTSQEESNEPNNSRLEAIAHKQICLNSPSQNHQRATFLLRHLFIHSKFHFMAWILCQAKLESWSYYRNSGITILWGELEYLTKVRSFLSKLWYWKLPQFWKKWGSRNCVLKVNGL